MRPRRSVLYMPGSNARAIEKAKTLDADAVVLDLEDAVAPEAKEAARAAVADAVKGGGFGGREVVIRVNGLRTPYGEADFQAALKAGPNAILLPKVERVEDIEKARALMTGGPDIPLWAMIETPLAILEIKTLAGAAAARQAPLTCLVLGTNDLVKAGRVIPAADRAPLVPWFMTAVAAARAFGLAIIDGVYNAIANEEGFQAECRQGRAMGMDGKTLIHPSQIGPCNKIFSPSSEEIDAARKVVAAFDRPENQGKGAINVDGRMVELLHAEIARDTLAMADAIQARV